MGVSGSVSYMFDHTAVFVFSGKSVDETFEILVEADVDVRDIEEEDDGQIVIYAEPDEFHNVQEALNAAGISEFAVAELAMLPKSEVALSGDELEQFEKLIDALEDLEDVQNVYHNVDLDEE